MKNRASIITSNMTNWVLIVVKLKPFENVDKERMVEVLCIMHKLIRRCKILFFLSIENILRISCGTVTEKYTTDKLIPPRQSH